MASFEVVVLFDRAVSTVGIQKLATQVTVEILVGGAWRACPTSCVGTGVDGHLWRPYDPVVSRFNKVQRCGVLGT